MGNPNTIERFSFQKEGTTFLKANPFSILADEMGVGKTVQALDAIDYSKRVLIVGPAISLYNWQCEFMKFKGVDAFVVEGNPVGGLPNQPIICSFNNITRYLNVYKRYHWGQVVIDEAHGLKQPTSQRTIAVLGSNGIIRHTEKLWALSGTPAPNHAGELWVWLKTFGYTTLSYDGFIDRYCTAFRDGNRYARLQITGSNTKYTPELKSMLKQFSLRRTKREVFKDMPPIMHNTYHIKPSDVDNEELKAKMLLEYEALSDRLDFDYKMAEGDNLLGLLKLMSGSLASLRRYHGLSKVPGAAELVRDEIELHLYEKIVIFGIHTDVLEQLAARLVHLHPAIVTGKTPPAVRFKEAERFQNDACCQVFIGNIQAAGTAITLTASNQVLFVEADWVPGNNDQAANRCHRHGQDKAVSVRYLTVPDSVDQKVMGALARKAQEISTFMT